MNKSDLKTQLKSILNDSAILYLKGKSNSDEYLVMFHILTILQEIANDYSADTKESIILQTATSEGRIPITSLENTNQHHQYWNIVSNILLKAANDLKLQDKEFNIDY